MIVLILSTRNSVGMKFNGTMEYDKTFGLVMPF